MIRPVPLDKIGSMNTRHTPESVPASQFIKARNVRLHHDEVHIKPGTTLVLIDPYDVELPLTGIGAFHDSGNKDVIIVLDKDGNLWGTNPYPGQPVGSSIITTGGSATVIADGNYLKLEVAAFPIPADKVMDTTAAYGRLIMAFSEGLVDTGEGIRQLYFRSDLGQYRYVGLGQSAVGPASYAQSATVGDVQSGTRYAIVLTKTETGYISGYSISDIVKVEITDDGFKVDVSGVGVHPDGNVIARIVAFTQAGASSEGPYFYIPDDDFIEGLNGAVDANGNNITKTVIENNAATTATFNFTDEYLLGSVDVTTFIDKTRPTNAKAISYSKTLRRIVLCGEDEDTFRFSEVDDPETFMATTGIAKPGQGDGGVAMCSREFRRELYCLRNNGAHLAQATALTPSEWGFQQVWSEVGPEGPWAVDVGEEFMAFAHRSGPYVYRGEAPEWIGYEITGNKKSDNPNWDQINWDYAHLIYVAIDEKNKLIKFGVPLGTSTQVNVELIVDYTDGWKNRRWSYDDMNSARTIYAKRPNIGNRTAVIASNAPDGKLLFEDEDSNTNDGTGEIIQEVQFGFYPGDDQSGVFQLDAVDAKVNGQGTVAVTVYGDAEQPPNVLEFGLAGTVKEFHRVLTVPPQNEQFSLSISNKGELGSEFSLQKMKMYVGPVWDNRIPQ